MRTVAVAAVCLALSGLSVVAASPGRAGSEAAGAAASREGWPAGSEHPWATRVTGALPAELTADQTTQPDGPAAVARRALPREAPADDCERAAHPGDGADPVTRRGSAGHPAAGPPQRCREPAITYTYTVDVRGEVSSDPEAFAQHTAAILTDDRGWALDGELGFAEVADGADVTLVLAAPAEVDAAHPVCSPRFSCRVEDEVLINDRTWREATPAFREAGGDLRTYRRYVIQHEVGHWLGYDHRRCPQPGETAPVMQQQSMALEGCAPHGWPSARERAAARDDHLP